MGTSSSSLFSQLSREEFQQRYSQISASTLFDNVLEMRVTVRSFEYKGAAESRIREYRELYEKNKNELSPIYAWVQHEGRVTYTMAATEAVEKVGRMKRRQVFHKLVKFLTTVGERLDMLAVLLQDDETFVAVLDHHFDLKQYVLRLMDLAKVEDLEKAIKDKDVADQVVRYFRGEHSLNDTLSRVQQL